MWKKPKMLLLKWFPGIYLDRLRKTSKASQDCYDIACYSFRPTKNHLRNHYTHFIFVLIVIIIITIVIEQVL